MNRTALVLAAGMVLLSPGAHAASSHAKAPAVARDAHGRIARSQAAKHEFLKAHPCPTGQKCIVDHIVPLACGGADLPSNMQLQSVEDARAKDRVERKRC